MGAENAEAITCFCASLIALVFGSAANGVVDWFPNQQGLLWFLDNCWSQIRHQNPDLQLFVAGRNAPQWLIEKLNVSGVVYVGEVENAYDFMAQHTIMIVPLLAGGGMRIKILEGLAYGKVIVSTSIDAV